METPAGHGELSHRQHSVLLATVQEFIATAEPVGSQQIATRYPLGVRAAMARNLMAELESAGYLRQPHTSAGRVPTDRAFRHYVDHVMSMRHIGFADRSQIELCYSTGPRELGEVMRETSRLLALLTGQAALVMAPRLESIRLERVSFVHLREREVLAIFVAAAGGVHNRLVQTESDHGQEELDRMARYLNEALHGARWRKRANGWSSQREDRARYDRFMRAALALGGALAERVGSSEVYVKAAPRSPTSRSSPTITACANCSTRSRTGARCSTCSNAASPTADSPCRSGRRISMRASRASAWSAASYQRRHDAAWEAWRSSVRCGWIRTGDSAGRLYRPHSLAPARTLSAVPTPGVPSRFRPADSDEGPLP